MLLFFLILKLNVNIFSAIPKILKINDIIRKIWTCFKNNFHKKCHSYFRIILQINIP